MIRIILLSLLMNQPSIIQSDQHKQDGVVLLHGILRTKANMYKIEKCLKQEGFDTLNITYPSTKYPIEELADKIHSQIHLFSSKINGQVHFVGYSMGGLLIRAYIKKHRPTNLGCIIMIGTPNHGSKLADFWKNSWLYKKIFGPAGRQLITDQNDFINILSYPDYDLGIIAGNRTIAPISSFIIGEASDGRVSVESTKVSGAKDHIVVQSSHLFLPIKKEVIDQTIFYIKHRKFKKP